METEIKSLLSSKGSSIESKGKIYTNLFTSLLSFIYYFYFFLNTFNEDQYPRNSEIDVQDLYTTLKESQENEGNSNPMNSEEEFWREIEHAEDRFETIARFFSRGIIP